MIVNDFPSGQSLPDQFHVYLQKNQASTAPKYGSEAIIIPTNNDYDHNPGCYIVCYRHQKGLYSPTMKNIFVVGQVRISGLYNKQGICEPLHQEQLDISQEKQFSSLCSQYFSACKKDSCWAGGDSGGWYR